MARNNRERVIGVFYDRSDAEACYSELLAAGVLGTDIGLMMSDDTRSRYYEFDNERESGSKAGSKLASGIGVGGTIGTAVGATLAAIAAAGTSVALPGLGLVIAGPIAAAVAGGGAGAFAGGLLGGLVGLGLSEQNAKSYNEALLKGGVVMAVTVAEGIKTSKIEEILVRTGAKEVSSY